MSQPAESEQNFIDGRFVAARGETIAVENPATHTTIGHIPDSDAEARGPPRRALPRLGALCVLGGRGAGHFECTLDAQQL